MVGSDEGLPGLCAGVAVAGFGHAPTQIRLPTVRTDSGGASLFTFSECPH